MVHILHRTTMEVEKKATFVSIWVFPEFSALLYLITDPLFQTGIWSPTEGGLPG